MNGPGIDLGQPLARRRDLVVTDHWPKGKPWPTPVEPVSSVMQPRSPRLVQAVIDRVASEPLVMPTPHFLRDGHDTVFPAELREVTREARNLSAQHSRSSELIECAVPTM